MADRRKRERASLFKDHKWIGKGKWNACTSDGVQGFEWRYVEKVEVESECAGL